MTISFVLALTVVFGYIQTTKVSTDDVKLIVEISRHGARAPANNTVKMPWIQNAGIGELTQTGKRMHYILGKNTALRYPRLFEGSLNSEEYFIRSTPFNRTIESAFSHMFGMVDLFTANDLTFENSAEQLLPPQKLLFDPSSLDFRTPLPNKLKIFPIHSRIGLDPDILSYNCPVIHALENAGLESWEKKLSESDKFMKVISDALLAYGLPSNFTYGRNIDTCFNLGDLATMDYYNNPSPKIDPKSDLYIQLEKCYWLWIIAGNDDTTFRKISTSYIASSIMSWFDQKINSSASGKSDFRLKYALFSGHDSTLIPLLYTLGLISESCIGTDLIEGKNSPDCMMGPNVASNMIFELILTGNNTFSTKVSYNGDYVDFCKTGDKSNDYMCDVEKFRGMINSDYYLSNFRQLCGIDDDGNSLNSSNLVTYKILFYCLLVVAVILVLVIAFMGYYLVNLSKKMQHAKRNQPLIQSEGDAKYNN